MRNDGHKKGTQTMLQKTQSHLHLRPLRILKVGGFLQISNVITNPGCLPATADIQLQGICDKGSKCCLQSGLFLCPACLFSEASCDPCCPLCSPHQSTDLKKPPTTTCHSARHTMMQKHCNQPSSCSCLTSLLLGRKHNGNNGIHLTCLWAQRTFMPKCISVDLSYKPQAPFLENVVLFL